MRNNFTLILMAVTKMTGHNIGEDVKKFRPHKLLVNGN